MRKSTLAAAIAVLLGSAAVAAQAQPAPTTTSQQPTAPQAPSPTTGADAPSDAGNKEGPSVGTPSSNVDEKSSSGSYYPYSSGTVGDDPAKPAATTAPTTGMNGDADENATTTEGWMNADADRDEYLSQAEFERAWPALGTRFGEIDVDGDKKLTRDELRTWHESQKTRMDADQPGRPATAAPPAMPATPATPAAPADPSPPTQQPATTTPPDQPGG